MTDQLRLEGGHSDLATLRANKSKPPLNDTQKAILRLLNQKGGIRAWEAGRLCHAARDGGRCWREKHFEEGGRGCCKWASSDGMEALKRLHARGLIERDLTNSKVWVRVQSHDPDPAWAPLLSN